MRCNLVFSLVRHKHHCRLCGYLVCSRCSSKKMQIDILLQAERLSRICTFCYDSNNLLITAATTTASSGTVFFFRFGNGDLGIFFKNCHVSGVWELSKYICLYNHYLGNTILMSSCFYARLHH